MVKLFLLEITFKSKLFIMNVACILEMLNIVLSWSSNPIYYFTSTHSGSSVIFGLSEQKIKFVSFFSNTILNTVTMFIVFIIPIYFYRTQEILQ